MRQPATAGWEDTFFPLLQLYVPHSLPRHERPTGIYPIRYPQPENKLIRALLPIMSERSLAMTTFICIYLTS